MTCQRTTAGLSVLVLALVDMKRGNRDIIPAEMRAAVEEAMMTARLP